MYVFMHVFLLLCVLFRHVVRSFAIGSLLVMYVCMCVALYLFMAPFFIDAVLSICSCVCRSSVMHAAGRSFVFYFFMYVLSSLVMSLFI